jgi:hypothetical protein
MLMQPRPIAETSRSLFPSFRFFIFPLSVMSNFLQGVFVDVGLLVSGMAHSADLGVSESGEACFGDRTTRLQASEGPRQRREEGAEGSEGRAGIGRNRSTFGDGGVYYWMCSHCLTKSMMYG